MGEALTYEALRMCQAFDSVEHINLHNDPVRWEKYYYSHFTDKEIESWREVVTYHGWAFSLNPAQQV